MSRNDDDRHYHHHSRHRSTHSRDRDRRSHHHGSHGHRDGTHHSRSHHDYQKTSSPMGNYQPTMHQDPAHHHQTPPPVFDSRQNFLPSPLVFNPNLLPPIAFPPQPFAPVPQALPFGFQPPPPTLGVLPNLAYPPLGFDGKSISTSALERLHLPQDKITETGIIPNNPYYELPAGLMVPLVPADRIEQQPLNPEDLRLPFPKFPDEAFLRMIDSFYSDDSSKRDYDGWDRSFIDMYMKQKEVMAKMQTGSSL